MKILAVNAGSSSLKANFYSLEPHESNGRPVPPLWRARADWSGSQKAEIRVETATGESTSTPCGALAPRDILRCVLESLWRGPAKVVTQPGEIEVVGHRIVHGGDRFRESVRITGEVRSEIARLIELAPSHNRMELAGVEAVESVLGASAPQIAVFDTAFHSTLAPEVFVYPGPYEWLEQGIRRYGFHGISHHYCSQQASRMLARGLKSLRLICCHLGSGCSLAAVREGNCVNTTMGFTPLDGLMMATRSGAVDPGILLHLLKRGHSAADLDRVLNEGSGLLGVSGVSPDMREILAAREDANPRAQLAFDLYVHRLRFYIAAMLPSLGGLDALVFTGGVGENSSAVREAVCQGLAFLGVFLNRHRNATVREDADISDAESRIRVLVIKAQEEWEIATECLRF
jgi:acetate kinase